MKLEEALATRQALLQLQLARLADAQSMALCALMMSQRPEDRPLAEDDLLTKNSAFGDDVMASTSVEDTSAVANLPSPELARRILADGLRGDTRKLMDYIEAAQGHVDECSDAETDEDGASDDDCEDPSLSDWWNPGEMNDEDGYSPDCPCD